MRLGSLGVIAAVVLLGTLLVLRGTQAPGGASGTARGPSNTTAVPPTAAPAVAPARAAVVTEGLEVPWALAFASDGALYATERPGRVVRVREGRQETVATLPDVSQRAESGLLGLALDPAFAQPSPRLRRAGKASDFDELSRVAGRPAFAENHRVYLYYTSARGVNRVVRFRVTERGLSEERVLLDNIPSAPFHDGGRIAFGPDGNLYVTTGDATDPELAQDRSSLAGKILRIRPDGSIPPDNPFPGSPVYSLGHRNPQGLAWAAEGTLYATEHGPSGVPPNCCHDEINRIEAGQNYGWPRRAGMELGSSGMAGSGSSTDPIIESGPAETWAPAGAAIVDDTLFFGGLRGEALFSLNPKNPIVVRKHFEGEFGRIRDVVRGPDGMLYLTTSNRDGRGNPRPGDDKILRIDPTTLR